ncbi:acetate--CoA ligase family protein [Limobrevibacterium gyesilva]|uniref:Acetate--CoA ligase family protein n=1 Tax=Limobrevibacterium gyesilva TaxID=2991712 RepID=A0AA41YH45_9PROT|nr:acetate--CoA ligase family protein [Limobrevibacterium gyesilva]MCW3473084.1 acetate--CoA ligase family protein [Limobrevibacterium gyesilva]
MSEPAATQSGQGPASRACGGGVGAAGARFASLTPLLNPRSVAVLGASTDPTRIGGRPIAYMRKQGFAGRIFPVNPRREEVQGLRAYPSVADLPEVPDVAVVAVSAELAVPAVADLAAAGVKGAIVLTAGFAEVDEAGAEAQARMVATAKAAGMRMLGPNCLGLFNARIGFYPIFSSSFENGWPRPGRIGIVSQSGAYGTHLFAAARDRGLGTPLCVTTGNEGDVTIGDVIGWLAEDPETDVIAAYAEGIRESEGLLAALAAARAARKPVVMMKVGRSALGTAAAKSHTASIAGDDAVTDAVLAEFGVVRARTTEEMLDIAQLASRRIYPARNTLGVMTMSGGAGVLISDAADELGVPMPEMPADAQARLKALVSFCAPRNPVDCTAQAFNDFSLVGRFADAVAGDGGYSSILCFFSQIGGAPSMVPKLRTELNATRAKYPDRLYVLSVLAPPEVVRDYEADGFTVFEDPSRAVVAIEAMGRFGAAFAAAPDAAPPSVPVVALPAATPSEAEAKRLLAEAGIPSAPERACPTADAAVAAAASFGFPVVMKILSPDILHKSEIGGVLLDVADADGVRAGFATLLERARAAAPAARIEGVLVAKQLQGGVECILGIHRDPVFGPVAMFGLGGVFVEVLKDVVFRRCPFGEDVAERMIRSIRGAPLLLGARGRQPADIKALARMLARLSVFAHQAGAAVQAVDLNPVFAMPEGEGAYAADAVIEIGGT